MGEKIKDFFFGLFYILVFIPYSIIFGKSDKDRKVKDIVKRCKKNGTSVRFSCDGYIVDIYEPGTNLDGPFDM